ncbi:DUF6541 family protein [Pseudarthrobacter sp. IC2-21]|uniref:DUF6541 family protein n=1 Tax=Pseudarthrobacter sp. IC2-21 TaxID=3092262 RepID=UPI002A6AB582|nr:DUF6541 family protein [Pseudarthrobacter sp. IC2-21]
MWLSVLPQILLAAVLLLAPGLVVALSLRFRSFDAFALAPALSVGVLVVASTTMPFLGLRFGPLQIAATTVVLAGIGLGVTKFIPLVHTPPGTVLPSRWRQVVPFAAFAVACVLIARRTFQAIGTPESISQTYDAVFHLNSVRFALDTGQASSLTIGSMTGGGFYPAGWNAVATFVASSTGADVPVAVNITSIILASVFWPLSCILMTTWIAGRCTSATLTAGVACASLGAFPLLMMDFGVLYPNLLAISVLPAGIALAARILGVAKAGKGSGLPMILALLLTLCGLAVAHPTTFMAWLLWTLPMVAYNACQMVPGLWSDRTKIRRRVNVTLAGFIGYFLVVVVLWLFLRPPEEASFWGPYHTVPQSLGEALFLSPMGLAPAWLVAPLALLGLWACFRRPQNFAWAGAAFVIFSAIFVVVAGFPISPFRDFLAGVWYNDSYRVAALLPVSGVLLASIGVAWADGRLRNRLWQRPTHNFLGRFIRLNSSGGWLSRRAAGFGILLVAAIALGQQGGLQQEANQAATHYALTEESPLVSTDEMTLMRRLPKTVPADSILLGNPYTGAALSYALGDRKSAQMHILSYVSPEVQTIYQDLGMVSSDPEVCDAVRDEDAFYVLDFGSKEIHGGNHTPQGLKDLDRNPGVQLVDRQGEARLYRISACDN